MIFGPKLISFNIPIRLKASLSIFPISIFLICAYFADMAACICYVNKNSPCAGFWVSYFENLSREVLETKSEIQLNGYPKTSRRAACSTSPIYKIDFTDLACAASYSARASRVSFVAGHIFLTCQPTAPTNRESARARSIVVPVFVLTRRWSGVM